MLERSDKTLPQFWSEPLANAFEDVTFGTSGPDMPRQMLELPPGGAWIPVLERSEMTLPQFWSEPVAKRLEDATLEVPAASGAVMPRQMVDLPPGGACTPVLDRSEMTLPLFWLAPEANRFDDVTFASATSGPVIPRQMLELPPGAAWILVVDLSVMTLPQFWFDP